jgi:hypothetical protein
MTAGAWRNLPWSGERIGPTLPGRRAKFSVSCQRQESCPCLTKKPSQSGPSLVGSTPGPGAAHRRGVHPPYSGLD